VAGVYHTPSKTRWREMFLKSLEETPCLLLAGVYHTPSKTRWREMFFKSLVETPCLQLAGVYHTPSKTRWREMFFKSLVETPCVLLAGVYHTPSKTRYLKVSRTRDTLLPSKTRCGEISRGWRNFQGMRTDNFFPLHHTSTRLSHIFLIQSKQSRSNQAVQLYIAYFSIAPCIQNSK